MSVAELDVARVDVFTRELFMGNPATVVFEADGLDEVLMQRIANEAASAITTYVLRSRKADTRMRFFSPFAEEPICAHGIIGGLWCLAERNAIGTGMRHRLETQIGIVPFSIDSGPDGVDMVWMTQSRPLFSKEGDEKEVASSIGIGVDAIFTREFPLSRASTGMPFLMVATRSNEVLGKLVPKQPEITALCHELDVAGITVYSWNVLEPGSTVHARCFLPSPGFPEDPASGLAAGALAAYLAENEFIPRERFGDIVIEQGHFMGRPSKIHVRVEKRGGVIRKVEVGGAARVSFRGRVTVP